MSEEKKEYGLRETDYYDLDEIKSRIEKRSAEMLVKKKKTRNKNLTVLILVIAIIGVVIFSFSKFFDVDHIAVEGNSHYTAEEIINMSHATPGKNLIYHPDKAEITGYLEKNTYIKKAEVHRKFPSTLVIEVTERTELGAIVYDDDYLIIDTEGILLRRTHTEPKITLIKGLVVKRIDLGEEIGIKDEELKTQALRLLNLANSNDLYFVKLDMSDMYIKANIYDALICKGTYSQLKEGIEKGRLHTVLETLFADGIKRGTIVFSDEGYASFQPGV